MLRLSILALAATLPQLLDASELTGAELLGALSDRNFDCMQGDIPLEWRFGALPADATTVAYAATVRGKTIEAEYALTDAGRLTSEGYGTERVVERNPDGTLTVTRADGVAMICTAR